MLLNRTQSVMLRGKQMNPQVLLSPGLLAFVLFLCGTDSACAISSLVLDHQVLPLSLGPKTHCGVFLSLGSCALVHSSSPREKSIQELGHFPESQQKPANPVCQLS